MKMNGNGLQVETEGVPVNGYTKMEVPLATTASSLSDHTKIDLLTEKFEEILHILGLDPEDDSLRDTPRRIARMYINEIFKGLDPKNRPKITLFKNTYDYHFPLLEMNIPFTSFCEHHFVPITGKANLVYIPKDKVIGLSKLHRLVDYHARRPQVQERLTTHIALDLIDCLQTEEVGVVLKASHSCISCRGVEHLGSSSITSFFSGSLAQNEGIKMQLFGS